MSNNININININNNNIDSMASVSIINPNGKVINIDNPVEFWANKEKEVMEKRKELKEWIKTVKDRQQPVNAWATVSGVPKEDEQGILQQVSPYLVHDVDGKPGNWSCGEIGSRWLDCMVRNPSGAGNYEVRVAFYSKKFKQMPEHLPGSYCLEYNCEFVPEQCVLCEKNITGWGHNARPIVDGKCCDDCNVQVLVERTKAMGMKMDKELLKTMMGRVPKKAEKVVIKEEDVQREILKARKEAERKAKEEAEEKARKEAREQRKRERKEEMFVKASVPVMEVSVVRNTGKEDDEAKEIRRRAKEMKVKVKTKNGGK